MPRPHTHGGTYSYDSTRRLHTHSPCSTQPRLHTSSVRAASAEHCAPRRAQPARAWPAVMASTRPRGAELVTCTITKTGATGAVKSPLSVAAPALKEVKLSLSLVGADDARVCCKSDGLRFNGGADTTVKLRTGMTYRLQLITAPAVAFTGPLLVRTRRAEFSEPGMLDSCCSCLPGGGTRAATKYADISAGTEWDDPVAADLQVLSGDGSSGSTRGASGGGGGGALAGGKAAAEAVWTCGMDVTGHGFRGELEVEVSIQGYGRALLPLQAKVYSEADASAKHGVPLRSVDYLLMRHGITGEIKVLNASYTK